MRYVSTRGHAPVLGFTDVLLTGLASDGGLYVPEDLPKLPDLPAEGGYADVAAAIITPFVGDDIEPVDLLRLCHRAYGTFRHPAVAPLVQVDHDAWVQELFHGPTLAFKDVALQLVGRLFDHVLVERGERATIVGATSGDTGSAAIDGMKACSHVDIVILYPAGRISDVQRRQMTTVEALNVHAVAVDGTFDECQALVKGLFADAAFREEMRLSAVNSINFARIVAQIVYYVTAATSLARPPTFCVPTGNFGNVYSGWMAQQMGAPIAGFIVASNVNDIVARFVETGVMRTADVVPTLSPSMDIQVSSNVERLLFEINGRDGGLTAEQLDRFHQTGELRIEADQVANWLTGTFRSARIDDGETLDEIRRHHSRTGTLVDPHTAVALGAVDKLKASGHLTGPVVALATAHPAKFPEAVERATGVRPPLPVHLHDLFDRPERIEPVANDVVVLKNLIRRLVVG